MVGIGCTVPVARSPGRTTYRQDRHAGPLPRHTVQYGQCLLPRGEPDDVRRKLARHNAGCGHCRWRVRLLPGEQRRVDRAQPGRRIGAQLLGEAM